MKVQQGDFVTTVAYGHGFSKGMPVGQVSLCQLVWKFVAGFFLWPLDAFIQVGRRFSAMALGYSLKQENGEMVLVSYWWVPKVGGVRISPFLIAGLCLLAVVLGTGAGIHSVVGEFIAENPGVQGVLPYLGVPALGIFAWTVWWIFCFAVGTLLFLFCVSLGFFLFVAACLPVRQGFLLIVDFVSARKEKICPFVEILPRE